MYECVPHINIMKVSLFCVHLRHIDIVTRCTSDTCDIGNVADLDQVLLEHYYRQQGIDTIQTPENPL